jgi:two-component system, chemotaxis family, CheB/CheR fusion protein
MERAPRPCDLGGLHVLHVEDNADFREALASVLDFYGALVTSAPSPTAAFALLRRRHVDVIVSDLALRGEDGLSFIRRLRALPASAGGAIPAVALTGLDHAVYERQALAAGFQAYLEKPPDLGQLFRVFGRLGLPVDIGLADIA